MSFFDSDPIFGQKTIWQLPPNTAEIANVSSFPLGTLKRLENVEPVGITYHQTVYPPDSTIYELDETLAEQYEMNEILRKKIQQVDIGDYYALLDLAERRFSSTTEEITAGYKKINVLMHPDKTTSSNRDDAEARFIAIQKAYETLTDPKARVVYDSSRPFDESIPTVKDSDIAESPELFYQIFTPVFERNSVFSILKPVPSLGTADSPWPLVDKFYQFWFNFKSWREFSHLDTERVGDSASRDERRWAEQKNKKGREKLKNAENARIRKLVERAYALDPRVKTEKNRILEEKNRIAAEKKRIEEEKKHQLAQKKQLEEEKKKAEEKERERVKKAEEEEKKRIRLATAAMKDEFKVNLLDATEKQRDVYDVDMINRILDKFTYEKGMEIKEWKEQNTANVDQFLTIPIVAAIIQQVDDDIKQAQEAEARSLAKIAEEKRLAEEEEAKRAIWSLDELSMLAKATQKIPIGTKDRWEKIAEMVSTVGKRTAKEVVRKIKQQEVAKQANTLTGSAAGMGAGSILSASSAFDSFQKRMEKEKEHALKSNAHAAAILVYGEEYKGASKTYRYIPEPDEKEEKKDKKEKDKEEKKDKKDKKDKKNKDSKDKSDDKDKSGSGSKSGDAKREHDNTIIDVSVNDVWTAEQQAALENGLRTIPKDAENRWQKIADGISGKTAMQAMTRFKFIRDEIMKKKMAAQK